MKKKAQLWISAVLYVLIIVAVIVIVIEALTPVVENLKDKNVYTRTRDTFLSIDDYIKDVSSEGVGSQRTIPIEIQKGNFQVENNSIKWNLETDAYILEPRTQVELGNLLVVANGEVDAYETNNSLIMKNSRVLFEFHKYGSPSDFANKTNVSGETIHFTGGTIIRRAALIEGGTIYNVTPSYNFFIPPDTEDTVVNGYTYMVREGKDLGKSSVITHINSSNHEYKIKFTLESQADYLEVETEKVLH